MGTTLGRRQVQAGRLSGRGASKPQSLGINTAMSCERCTLHVRSLSTNLLDFGQILGCVDTERLYAHPIPIMATTPHICQSSGSDCDVALL